MRLEQSTHCVFAYTGHRIDGLTGHPMSAPVPKKTRKEDYQVRLLRELCSRIFLDPCEKKIIPWRGNYEEVGSSGRIRTHGTFRYDGFQDRCIQPDSVTPPRSDTCHSVTLRFSNKSAYQDSDLSY